MSTLLVNSYFPELVLTENILAITGLVPGTSMDSYLLAQTNPMFYIGKDNTGADILCCVKTDQAILRLGTATGVFTATLVPDVTAASSVLIGGRPVHKPK